jgi:uncharacterized protein (TIGR04255 family)
MPKIKLRNPPINELVIGTYFERDLPTFGLEHVGLFWSIIRHEFPVVSQNPVLVSAPLAPSPAIEFTIEQFPMPRFWFEAADGITLIQLQKNAFIFNWRKRNNDYPHFQAVKAAFDKYLSIFLEFLTKEVRITPPNFRVLELAYVNNLFPSEYWKGPRDTSAVLPLFRLPIVEDENAFSPPDFHQASVQRLAPDLTLGITVRTSRSGKDATEPVLVFELRAVGVLDEAARPDVDDWFQRAHDKIGDCFLSMTSLEIRNRYWQPM